MMVNSRYGCRAIRQGVGGVEDRRQGGVRRERSRLAVGLAAGDQSREVAVHDAAAERTSFLGLVRAGDHVEDRQTGLCMSLRIDGRDVKSRIGWPASGTPWSRASGRRR